MNIEHLTADELHTVVQDCFALITTDAHATNPWESVADALRLMEPRDGEGGRDRMLRVALTIKMLATVTVGIAEALATEAGRTREVVLQDLLLGVERRWVERGGA